MQKCLQAASVLLEIKNEDDTKIRTWVSRMNAQRLLAMGLQGQRRAENISFSQHGETI